ncbi:Chromatin SPT2 [Penicillium odoratum]|uniref:Chromatin SPT2 n=1 Tax=Penicillium odoratum TaxID=1167516 RepID=UPI002547EC4C|nr:Chromatin SPT2 [Penicillium odoratum]KAJ5776914.1 Chromatin SPT2 [Penicillium odoratum]
MNGGTKRKAEDQLPRSTRPGGPVSTRPANQPVATSGVSKTAPKPTPAPNRKVTEAKPVSKNGTAGVKKAAPAKSASTKPDSAAPPSKAPPKGSYADLMAQAKARQEQAPTLVGVIRNQVAPREKQPLRHRLQEAKARAKMEKKGKRFEPSGPERKYGHKRSPEHPHKRSPEVPSYKGTAKPTQTPEPPAYRGTAGLPGKNGSNDRRQHGKRRMDEYLGTDEEDEGHYGGYDDYSDASSDMEAGFDDVEEEEDTALKNARKEDEEELRREMAAKKEKMERQKRLAALASRKR